MVPCAEFMQKMVLAPHIVEDARESGNEGFRKALPTVHIATPVLNHACPLRGWVFVMHIRVYFCCSWPFFLGIIGAQVAQVLLSLLLSLLSFRVEASFLLIYLRENLIFWPETRRLSRDQ